MKKWPAPTFKCNSYRFIQLNCDSLYTSQRNSNLAIILI